MLRLLKILVVGLMLACGSAAYASEPPAPAPVTQVKDKMPHMHPRNQNVLVSTNVGDAITDWSIAILGIIALMFFSMNFVDKKNRRK